MTDNHLASKGDSCLAEAPIFELDDSIFRLGLTIFKRLSRKSTNICISPAGLHSLISALALTCQNKEANEEVWRLLQIQPGRDVLNSLCYQWCCFLTAHDDPCLKIKMHLFSERSRKPSDETRDILENAFQSEMTDQDPESASKQWLRTHKMVREMMTGPAPLLFQMVSFRSAEWDWNYDWEMIFNFSFHVDKNLTVPTTFMYDEQYLYYTYSQLARVEILRLQLKNPAKSLVIYLPENITELETVISSPFFIRMTEGLLLRTPMRVYLPLFTKSSVFDVQSVLKGTSPDMVSNTVKQLCQFEINEPTQLNCRHEMTGRLDGMGCDDKLKVFMANKPFIFLLYHDTKLLIMGKMLNPNSNV